ncbi:NAD(P)H-binding protein [Microbacterium sp. Kw_RZR3]|nr:NAD(P)H-binding protein [Microbacterium sp. Kw_RZR3]MDF2044906.1 NAD(P)H-binding protein [Microbacterium sp. Kw_RZR3]
MTPHALIIGATGPMGRAVLARADALSLRVRALARRPGALAGVTDDVVAGDVMDVETIVAALDGIDAVISVLGSRPRASDAHLLENGTRNVVHAMRERGVRRLLCVTGMGAGDSWGHGPLWYDALVRPTILRSVYADKNRQEAVVRESRTSWTLVRPAVLVNTPQPRLVLAKSRLAPRERMGPLTRTDVACFLVSELLEPAYVGQTVHLFT